MTKGTKENTKTLELKHGINLIAKGLQKLNNNKSSMSERADGIRNIQNGALIINTQSHIHYKSLKDEEKADYTYFPINIREILEVCENTMSDWYYDFPVIEKFLPDFEYNESQLIDKTLNNITEGADNFLLGKSEYEIYEEFYEQKVFKDIRNACADDEDYCASRAYLPITIPQLSVAHKLIKTKSNSLNNLILLSYYEYFNPKKYNYVTTKQGYALCECGYPLIYNELNELECSHQKCKQIHQMKHEQTTIHSYTENIGLIIKPQFHRFLTLPAREELSFYNLLKLYENAGIITNLKLYPYKDAADISFEYNDTLHIIDVKEWVNPLDLLKDIKSKNGLLSNLFNKDIERLNGNYKVFLVIPDYLCREVRGKSKYIQRLKSLNEGKRKEDKGYINIVTINKFIPKYLPKIKKAKGNKTLCDKATQISWT